MLRLYVSLGSVWCCLLWCGTNMTWVGSEKHHVFILSKVSSGFVLTHVGMPTHYCGERAAGVRVVWTLLNCLTLFAFISWFVYVLFGKAALLYLFCFLYWNIFSVRTQGGLATEANGDGELKLNKSFISVKRRGTQEFVLTLIMYHLHLFFLITCIFSVSFTYVQMFWFWLHVFLCLV